MEVLRNSFRKFIDSTEIQFSFIENDERGMPMHFGICTCARRKINDDAMRKRDGGYAVCGKDEFI